MKKGFCFLFFVFLCGLFVDAWAVVPGQITITSVSNSTSASSWTLLQGTDQTVPQYDSYGNKYTSQAFQIAPADGTSAFSYAYTNTPSAYFTWWTNLWGPLQNNMNFPNKGVFVCTTPGAGTVNFSCESK